MSRLTDLMSQPKHFDAQLGGNRETEIRAPSQRPAVGLNFERHQLETFKRCRAGAGVQSKDVRVVPLSSTDLIR